MHLDTCWHEVTSYWACSDCIDKYLHDGCCVRGYHGDWYAELVTMIGKSQGMISCGGSDHTLLLLILRGGDR